MQGQGEVSSPLCVVLIESIELSSCLMMMVMMMVVMNDGNEW